MTDPAMRHAELTPIDYTPKKMDNCACGCGSKAAWKERYGAFLNNHCIEKLERKAARKAVLELQKEWRAR